jgi:hypothetical protein
MIQGEALKVKYFQYYKAARSPTARFFPQIRLPQCSFNSKYSTSHMAIISARIDDRVVTKFRHVLYTKHGLKKGDLKQGLEEAMLDYIQKYSKPRSAINKLATTAKTISPDTSKEIGTTIQKLQELGADVDTIRRMNPTDRQLTDLLEGLKKLHAEK